MWAQLRKWVDHQQKKSSSNIFDERVDKKMISKKKVLSKVYLCSQMFCWEFAEKVWFCGTLMFFDVFDIDGQVKAKR